MDEFKVIEIKKSVFENNDREADRIRERLKKEHTFLLNLMSSPGSGKTTTLKATISRLKDEMKIGVMDADIDSSVDAKAIAETGVKSIQLHTLGMCHLDAGMTEQGIDEFGTDELDLVVLENVGNPLGVLFVGFLTSNRLDIFRMSKDNLTGWLKDVVNGNPVLSR